ncbi:MAG: hypothetical protein Q7R96_02375 [Nanoarchaeota archaeon]|nr:hypothetical protein [Nanoarchaeota archaeon]
MVLQRSIRLNPDSDDMLADCREFLRFVKRDGIYRPDLLYRGFNGKKLGLMLSQGTDLTRTTDEFDARKQTFCSTKHQLLQIDDTGLNAMRHAIGAKIPAIAVYNGSLLTVLDEAFCLYEFNNPAKKLDALIAVYLIH